MAEPLPQDPFDAAADAVRFAGSQVFANQRGYLPEDPNHPNDLTAFGGYGPRNLAYHGGQFPGGDTAVNPLLVVPDRDLSPLAAHAYQARPQPQRARGPLFAPFPVHGRHSGGEISTGVRARERAQKIRAAIGSAALTEVRSVGRAVTWPLRAAGRGVARATSRPRAAVAGAARVARDTARDARDALAGVPGDPLVPEWATQASADLKTAAAEVSRDPDRNIVLRKVGAVAILGTRLLLDNYSRDLGKLRRLARRPAPRAADPRMVFHRINSEGGFDNPPGFDPADVVFRFDPDFGTPLPDLGPPPPLLNPDDPRNHEA